jgi:hypothetical protein
VVEAAVSCGVVEAAEMGAALLGGGAGDCPEAEVAKNVADVNTNATEALMHARDIDT